MKSMSLSSLTISHRAALEIIERWKWIVAMDIECLEALRVIRDQSWHRTKPDSDPFRMVDVNGDAAAFRDVRKRQRDVLDNVLEEMRWMRTDADVAISDLSALRFLVFGNQDPENMLFPFDIEGEVVKKP